MCVCVWKLVKSRFLINIISKHCFYRALLAPGFGVAFIIWVVHSNCHLAVAAMADLPSDDEHGPEIKTGPDLLALTHKAIPDFKTPTPARKRLEFLDDQFLGQHSHYPMI